MSAISAVKCPAEHGHRAPHDAGATSTPCSRTSEREIDIGGLWVITGFEQLPLWVSKHSTSETTYTFAHKVSVLANSVTSFSNLPLVAIFYMGAALFLAACAFAGSALLQWLFLSRPVGGLTTLLVSRLAARRTDHLVRRNRRHLPFQGVFRSQATPLHHRPGGLWP